MRAAIAAPATRSAGPGTILGLILAGTWQRDGRENHLGRFRQVEDCVLVCDCCGRRGFEECVASYIGSKLVEICTRCVVETVQAASSRPVASRDPVQEGIDAFGMFMRGPPGV